MPIKCDDDSLLWTALAVGVAINCTRLSMKTPVSRTILRAALLNLSVGLYRFFSCGPQKGRDFSPLTATFWKLWNIQ
jgi:hypothetical protein